VPFDPRKIISDPNAPFAGAKVSEKTVLPVNSARLCETRFETWVTHSQHKSLREIGCAPNTNSCGTTRKAKVPTGTHEEVTWVGQMKD